MFPRQTLQISMFGDHEAMITSANIDHGPSWTTTMCNTTFSISTHFSLQQKYPMLRFGVYIPVIKRMKYDQWCLPLSSCNYRFTTVISCCRCIVQPPIYDKYIRSCQCHITKTLTIHRNRMHKAFSTVILFSHIRSAGKQFFHI